MAGLAQAMEMLKATFDKYAGKDGNKTLSKAELAELLRKELCPGAVPDQAAVDEFFSNLDDDGDGVVDFKEYVTFVAALSAMCQHK